MAKAYGKKIEVLIGNDLGTIWEPDGIPFGTWWEHSENTSGNQRNKNPPPPPTQKGPISVC